MQRRPNNPIELKKQQVRKYSRNAVVSVVGGVAGGVLLGWALTGFWTWMTLGLIVAVVGGVYNWTKVQKIVNENNNR
ncbi:putative secreted protein [Corynebacterium striatum]|nr:putative secreted protein [Corynebacterium striatum]STD62485.1 putative secreted protein [Corynebacterium striatum]